MSGYKLARLPISFLSCGSMESLPLYVISACIYACLYIVQLKKPSHSSCGIPTSINCLATLLKEPLVRSSFVQADGVKFLTPLIIPASSQQSIQVIHVQNHLLCKLYHIVMHVKFDRLVSKIIYHSSLITFNF